MTESQAGPAEAVATAEMAVMPYMYIRGKGFHAIRPILDLSEAQAAKEEPAEPEAQAETVTTMIMQIRLPEREIPERAVAEVRAAEAEKVETVNLP